MSYMNEGLAFIDTETTGLDAKHNPIWEVAVIVDGVEHHWQQRLPLWAQPGRSCYGDPVWRPHGAEYGLPICDGIHASRGASVSPWSIANGLDRYNHATAISPRESIERFAELTSGRAIVGSNPSFDISRLARLYEYHFDGTPPWDYHLIDIRSAVVPRAIDYWVRLDEATGGDAGDRPSPLWSTARLSEMIGVDPPEHGFILSALGDARWVKEMWETVMA